MKQKFITWLVVIIILLILLIVTGAVTIDIEIEE